MALEKLDKPHVCIRIFEDETVLITNEDGTAEIGLKPPEPGEPDRGPWNTYDQAVWYHGSPV